jgi:antitoxin component of RelBE/YafQ-DinJ toxin-antitoxin module
MTDIDGATTDTYVFRQYGLVISVTITIILTNIAAFTNFPTELASTVYVNGKIDRDLTKETITDTLRSDRDSSFYFIDVKDYGCRRNDSLLNYVILRGNVSPSSHSGTLQPRLFAKDLEVKFCQNSTSVDDNSYTVSFLPSSGCNVDAIDECSSNSSCNIKLDRYLPLRQLCNAEITLEWRSFLKIQDTARRSSIVISLFQSRAILK